MSFTVGTRPPRQERSRQSLERVLTAGAELLAEQGWEGFTIAEVAHRAHASVGLIYRRFDSKAALFEAILVRETARSAREESEALNALVSSHLPVAQFVAEAVRAIAAIAYRQASLTQVFSERSIVDPRLMEHVKELRTTPGRFVQLLVDRGDQLAHDDPERAAEMAFWIANSAVERRIHTPMWRYWDPEAEHDWPQFVEDLVRAVQAFLLCPDPAGP